MPTNVWDTTQPPDTQFANLLGQDIRNLKLDTQQRMGLISGTFANRWNPATDAQPANWTGLLYFATDTGQVFQWNGAAWIQVGVLPTAGGGSVITKFTDLTQYNVTVNTTTAGITIPANLLQLGSFIYVRAFIKNGSSGGVAAANILVNGINALNFNFNSAASGYLGLEIAMTGAVNNAQGMYYCNGTPSAITFYSLGIALNAPTVINTSLFPFGGVAMQQTGLVVIVYS